MEFLTEDVYGILISYRLIDTNKLALSKLRQFPCTLMIALLVIHLTFQLIRLNIMDIEYC